MVKIQILDAIKSKMTDFRKQMSSILSMPKMYRGDIMVNLSHKIIIEEMIIGVKALKTRCYSG